MNERSYICVRWLHTFPDEPVELWSELDADRWEIRKVEIWSDGRVAYVSHDGEFGDTGLGECAIPPLAEIASDPQFQPEEVSQSDFEAIWKAYVR